MHPAEPFQHRPLQRADRLDIADIGFDGNDIGLRILGDRRHRCPGFRQPVPVDVGQNDAHAAGSKGLGCGKADARGGPGHNRDVALLHYRL